MTTRSNLESIDEDFKLIASKNGYIVAEKNVVFNEKEESYDEDLDLMPIIDYYLAGAVKDKKENLTVKT